MKTLAIIGSGHLGQQIAHYAVSDNHYGEVVFFDDFSTEGQVNGFPVLGNSGDIGKVFAHKGFDELLIGIGYKHLDVRRELFERFEGKIPFGRIIHSSCWIDKTAAIGAGCVLYPSCSVDAHAVINDNAILNIGCTVAHDTTIGAHCFLSPRVALAGFVKVGQQCIIGINATVIDNISITAKTQVGGSTVIIESITKSGLYVGNPQRFIR